MTENLSQLLEEKKTFNGILLLPLLAEGGARRILEITGDYPASPTKRDV